MRLPATLAKETLPSVPNRASHPAGNFRKIRRSGSIRISCRKQIKLAQISASRPIFRRLKAQDLAAVETLKKRGPQICRSIRMSV